MVEAILCSIPEAAKALGIGRSKIYCLLNEGALETVAIGSRRLVKVESIRSLVESSTKREAA